MKTSIEINYAPDFKTRWGSGLPPAKHVLRILEGKSEQQKQQLEAFATLSPFLSAIKWDEPEDSPEPRWHQPWFPPLDGISMYSLVAQRKPYRLIEIGSGNSTKFARRAIKDHGLHTTITSIDPQPRAEVNAICDLVIRKPLETCDLSLFEGLSERDIVFFDGSHRCFQNSDVTVFFIEVLPALKPGTLVGIHDIYWPDDYPPDWVARYYNEQYMLGAYMLALRDKFPLVLSNAWAGPNLAAFARRCLNPSTLAEVRNVGGGALWFEVPG
jgi:hypothetical protein